MLAAQSWAVLVLEIRFCMCEYVVSTNCTLMCVWRVLRERGCVPLRAVLACAAVRDAHAAYRCKVAIAVSIAMNRCVMGGVQCRRVLQFRLTEIRKQADAHSATQRATDTVSW